MWYCLILYFTVMLSSNFRVRAIKTKRKKTMSEDEKMTKEKCEADGGSWNEEKGECTMPTAAAEAKAIDFNLTQRIEHVIKEVVDKKLDALEKAIDLKIDTLLKGKEIEMEQALRKGFGLDNDPVIHQSDLVAAFRKAALENTEKQRAPAASEKAGPEGNLSEDPFEKMLKPFTEEKKN
jgi:hypothetical protein